MKFPILYWLLSLGCVYAVLLPHDGQKGPSFIHEPPSKVEFHNNTGTTVPCSAQGQPIPLVTWTHQDGSTLRDVTGLRHVRPDGTLVFPPFSAEVYRQDVHDAVYKCVATNAVGTIGSRDVHVRAVVQRRYKVQVYDHFAVRGNTAVLSCQVPSFVQDYITFVSWKREDNFIITSTVTRGGRYSILPTGELYIRGVTQADGQRSYSCQTRHRLTGELTYSASSGKLFVTEPHGAQPPKISHSQTSVSAREGDNVELACAATASPPPTYRWYREEEGELIPLVTSHRIIQLDGSLVVQFASIQDSGKYICVANNSAGEDTTTTKLTVSAPLSVYITPQIQVVDIGRSATFNCSVSGHPLRSVHWIKDLRPIADILGGRITLLARDVLHITSVVREDRGMYQCFACNDLESVQSSAELKLGDAAPVMLSTFSDEAVRPGSFVPLRCSASGNPLPQLTWTLDDAQIPDAVRFRTGDFVTTDAHVVSYVNISDARVEDGGEYKCSASNTVSTVSHMARIDVYGPPIVRKMSNVSVVAGRTMVVRCPVSGYPLESVTYVKDGATLPTNHRQKVEFLGKLVVHDVQRTSDEGLYTCVAKGQEGKTAKGNLYVHVRVAPLIDEQLLPETMYSKEATKVKLMCSTVQGDSPIRVVWTKNGLPVPFEKDVITLQNFEDSAILVFRKVNFKHSGNYTCTASNIAASVNRTSHLIVNVPPRWAVEPLNSYVVRGQNVTMDCSADGYPHPRMYWKKAKGEKPSDFREVLSSYKHQVFANGSLVIQRAEETDGGHYLCQATNGIGTGLSKVIFLTIHTPPKFDTNFMTRTVTKGKDAQLKCEATGDLPISIEWMKDKIPLDQSSLRRLTVDVETGTGSVTSGLTISDVGKQDSSLYSCIASNKFGEADTHMQLVVQEPPSPPVDVEVEDKTSRSVVLRWSASFSGNSPITKYIVQHGNSTVSLEAHLTDTEVPGLDTTATIRSLLPATTYHFRVKACNALGESEPSDFIHVVTQEEVPGGPPLSVDVRPTGSQSIKVTWMPPRKELQYGKIQGYYIGYKVRGTDDQYQYKNVEARDGEQLSYLTNLRRMTEYTVMVQAYNNVGAGPRSDEVTATTLEAAPPTSPHLRLSSETTSSLTVQWERHQDDTVLKDYELYYTAEGSEWKKQRLSTNADHYKLEGLKCGTRYRLYMTASNSLGSGEPGEIVTARTHGAAPVSPHKDGFLIVNATSLTLVFGAWQTGGCPITYYTVYFRYQREWKPVNEHVDASQHQLLIPHLVPNREYTLRVSAHSEAGTTEAEYRFTTLNITTLPPTMKPISSSMVPDGTLPFYRNLTVLLPVVISIAVLLVVIITVIVCLRRQADSGSSSGDSRKGRNCENMGLTEFPPKTIKDGDPYDRKSSYYSSPSRKPIAVASSSNRGIPPELGPSLTIKKYSGWS